jgi:propanol-preferring alcohol dehydrogenase
MRAMTLQRRGAGRLVEAEIPERAPGAGEVLIRVRACGVCRTDLHVVDGELPVAELPVVPGHEVVGTVAAVGEGVDGLSTGQRVGLPWLGWACGTCGYCREGRENLCPRAAFTGWTRPGGYAEAVVADGRFVFPLPEGTDDVQIAPWLCAGFIGHRAYRLAGPAPRLGLYGFGAAGHLLLQVAAHEGREVFVFTRRGDAEAQRLARDLGAAWAGGSEDNAPVELDAAILFAPHGPLVPQALAQVRPGGSVVCAGIHMSDIPSFPYQLLWRERQLRSVANLTREDGRSFLALAPRVPVRSRVTSYPLADANRALDDLRAGRLVGAAVLVP